MKNRLCVAVSEVDVVCRPRLVCREQEEAGESVRLEPQAPTPAPRFPNTP